MHKNPFTINILNFSNSIHSPARTVPQGWPGSDLFAALGWEWAAGASNLKPTTDSD
jgi:hypothetical protein